MDKRLWTAIQELLDAAEYALKPLDRYSDYEDDPLGPVMVSNDALSAHGCLKQAAETVSKLMESVQPIDLKALHDQETLI